MLLASTINRVVNPPEGLETNEVTAEEAPAIDTSPAVELFIPAIEAHADFQDGSCLVANGAINPDSMNKACTYTAEDRPYSLPGTTAQDIVVIAGHTGAGVPGVFNNLYDGSANEHKVHLGDKLYVRTQNSEQNWLIYTATDLHDPDKQGLSDDASIWGEGPCPAVFSPSVAFNLPTLWSRECATRSSAGSMRALRTPRPKAPKPHWQEPAPSPRGIRSAR